MGTQMKVNRPETGGGGGVALTYHELETIVSIPAQSTLYVPIDAGSHRYEVKTVLAESVAVTKIAVRLDDRATAGDICYESLQEARVYDIVGVPITDKTGQKKIHAFIQNAGSATASIRVVIKIIPLEGGN